MVSEKQKPRRKYQFNCSNQFCQMKFDNLLKVLKKKENSTAL